MLKSSRSRNLVQRLEKFRRTAHGHGGSDIGGVEGVEAGPCCKKKDTSCSKDDKETAVGSTTTATSSNAHGCGLVPTAASPAESQSTMIAAQVPMSMSMPPAAKDAAAALPTSASASSSDGLIVQFARMVESLCVCK